MIPTQGEAVRALKNKAHHPDCHLGRDAECDCHVCWQQEIAQLKADNDQLRNIRKLCIRALVRATGATQLEIECAPFGEAVKAAKRAEAAEAALAKWEAELLAILQRDQPDYDCVTAIEEWHAAHLPGRATLPQPEQEQG